MKAAEEAFGKVKSVQSPGKSAKRASDPCKNKGWRETESGREDSGIGVAQEVVVPSCWARELAFYFASFVLATAFEVRPPIQAPE